MSLLPIFSGLTEPEARAALRIALQDSDSRVREAAIRTLCDTVDADLLDDLVDLARLRPDDNLRALAVAGAVRLTSEDKAKLTEGHRIGALRQLFGAAAHPEQKRLVLAGLAEVPQPDALRVVELALEDADVQTEASLAAIKIASALPSTLDQQSESVLKKAVEGATNVITRQALTAAIHQIEANADYISDWQITGPFTQSGKDYAALFDIVFPPETLEPENVLWQWLPPAGDPRRPWEMDLLKAFGGGTQCVAYARTWVHSDQDQNAQLELGSDDGIKVWLNEKQVYALNTSRELQRASDRASVHLHSGWNQLLLKITQNNQGWGFCARFRKPDGSPLEGLRSESVPNTDASAPGSR